MPTGSPVSRQKRAVGSPAGRPNPKRPALGRRMREQQQSLPIFRAKDRLLAAIRRQPAVIVVGETGSGKTTQLPQYLCDARMSRRGGTGRRMVAVTQPRRVAAVTVAARVAQERNEKVGSTVGYCVRFDEKSSPVTQVCLLRIAPALPWGTFSIQDVLAGTLTRRSST
jgi:HrpA-like RNA helicase